MRNAVIDDDELMKSFEFFSSSHIPITDTINIIKDDNHNIKNKTKIKANCLI